MRRDADLRARRQGDRAARREARGTDANLATQREQPTSGPVTTTTPDPSRPSAAELLDDLNTDLRRAEARTAEPEKALTADGKYTVVKMSLRLEQAERTRDDEMQGAASLQRARDFYERQLARCGRAVGTRDLDKIASAVEAFVRADSKVAAGARPRSTATRAA